MLDLGIFRERMLALFTSSSSLRKCIYPHQKNLAPTNRPQQGLEILNPGDTAGRGRRLTNYYSELSSLSNRYRAPLPISLTPILIRSPSPRSTPAVETQSRKPQEKEPERRKPMSPEETDSFAMTQRSWLREPIQGRDKIVYETRIWGVGWMMSCSAYHWIFLYCWCLTIITKGLLR